MSAARPRDLKLALASAAAVAVAVIVVTLLVPAQDPFPAGSSYSTAPQGAAAAFRTLRALGYQVRRSSDPVTALPDAPGSTVLVLADPVEPASNQDRRALQAFVAAGGTVVTTGCVGASFFVSDVRSDDNPFAQPQPYHAVVLSPLTIGAPKITMTPSCGGLDLGRQFAPLYASGGLAGVLSAHVGHGTAIWCASDTPLSNAAISDAHNFELLLNVVGARPRSVVWDEYYHGERRSLWSYTARTPLRWGLAQVALVLVVAAAVYARRRVPVRARHVDPRTSPLEFVDTMASLYGRTPSAAAAVGVARARLRRLLLAATGHTAGASDESVAAAAASRLGTSPAAVAELLESAAAAASTPATTADMALPLVQQMQTLAGGLRTGG